MHLIPPKPQRQQWTVRLRIHDGRTVKIPGDRDRATAERIGHRVELLVRAKAMGDLPPAELRPWIEAMRPSLSDRLVLLGLLERRVVDRGKPLDDQLEDFKDVIASRKSNTIGHASKQVGRLHRLFDRMGITNYSQITEDDVAKTLRTMNLAPATRRHYIVAAKDFCKWSGTKGFSNPLSNLKAPGQYVDPQHERVPLTVVQFQALLGYLTTFDKYKHQRSRWTAQDRTLIYWVAVKTAFRCAELAGLRVRSLALDATPPQVVVRAGEAKNNTKGSVPIPTDLADALREYVRNRDPDERLFPMPSVGHGTLNMFRRDLDGAKIRWNWGDDDPQIIDFHTLRSTAICWWLDVDGLPPKRVQILARLKTLALVATYSRNMTLGEFGWLNSGPKLV